MIPLQYQTMMISFIKFLNTWSRDNYPGNLLSSKVAWTQDIN